MKWMHFLASISVFRLMSTTFLEQRRDVIKEKEIQLNSIYFTNLAQVKVIICHTKVADTNIGLCVQPQSAGNCNIFPSFSLHLSLFAYIFTFDHSGHSLVSPSIAVILMSGPQGPAGVSAVVQQCYSKTLLQHLKRVSTVRTI